MIATASVPDVLTTPQLAALVQAPEWKLRAMIRKGRLAPPRKVGPTWVWRREDVERVRRALQEGGYIAAGSADKQE